MARFAHQVLCIFAALAICGGPSRGEEPLKILYNERPPYMVAHGKEVKGLTADAAVYAFNKAGIPYQWVEIPSSRQLFMLQENKEKLAALGWFRNPERERFAKVSSHLYMDRQIAVLARTDNAKVAGARSVTGLLGNSDLTLLAKSGYSYGRFLDEQIAKLEPRIMRVTVENLSMIRMIGARRADYMFIAPEEAGATIEHSGVPPKDLRLITFPDMPPGEFRYLLFSQRVDDETIRRINRYLDEYHSLQK
jgi:ABC-type amino acid transport substrate-binding protein